MLEIVKTSDGSNTIFNSEVGENYHSRHGALQESKHVFVKSGLQYFLDKSETKQISILEVGFGTGLNFLLSADYCFAENIQLNYTGIEAYPLTIEMISQTGYDEYVSPGIWQQFIKDYPSALQNAIELNKNCHLQIAKVKLMEFQSNQKFDVIYFDAFAAIHQPEMWNEAAITHTLQFLNPGGVFVTYAITGNLKRIVKGLGLKVEKAPGAPGKREMLRAVNQD
ncbi:tRNA (5-methylaminomethyl-2-thiouridine)(34)-methyltransferase MnmD [Mucilaginibacter sp. E4BP6]|uniref:tRNA (5-methylaminomethyl-2-thiouridine)(34)-methyltransferase MnmD n=1 Tax=Mucilaginibacter sp. E4BP6 TaxID=2723089 RepID=UPI0015CDF0FD